MISSQAAIGSSGCAQLQLVDMAACAAGSSSHFSEGRLLLTSCFNPSSNGDDKCRRPLTNLMEEPLEWFAVAQLQSEAISPQLAHITTMAAWQISRGAHAQASTDLIRVRVVALNLLNYVELRNLCKC